MRAAPGTNSRNSPSRLAARSAAKKLTPVRLPPGRAKLATRPSLTGSLPVAKTMGIVVVAALAARAEGVSIAAMTATRRRTSSAANAGSRSVWFSAQRYSIATLSPSTKPASFRPWRNPRDTSVNASGDWLLRKPITGIAGCCARAASGQAAAAPPRSVMNARRPRPRVPAERAPGCARSGTTLDREREPGPRATRCGPAASAILRFASLALGRRKSGIPDLRILKCRSRVYPRSVSRSVSLHSAGTREMNSRRLVCRESSIVKGDGGRFMTPPPSRLEARRRLGS